MLAAHAVSWWAVLAVAGVMVVVLGYRLLAERSRRKTLTAISRAPANTVVIVGKGPGGPSMWVWVGDGRPSAPSDLWALHWSAEQVRSRRRA